MTIVPSDMAMARALDHLQNDEPFRTQSTVWGPIARLELRDQVVDLFGNRLPQSSHPIFWGEAFADPERNLIDESQITLRKKNGERIRFGLMGFREAHAEGLMVCN